MRVSLKENNLLTSEFVIHLSGAELMAICRLSQNYQSPEWVAGEQKSVSWFAAACPQAIQDQAKKELYR